MSFNCPEFIKEFADFVKSLAVKSILEVGCYSGELKDAVGADGIDINPRREDVNKCDILDFKPKKKYDLVFSSGLLEHYEEIEQLRILNAMARVSNKYILNYVPNSGCEAYMKAKAKTKAAWKTEKDYTIKSLKQLHEKAGLEVIAEGFAGREWTKRFGSEPSEPYLVWVLAEKKQLKCPKCGSTKIELDFLSKVEPDTDGVTFDRVWICKKCGYSNFVE